MVPAILLKDPSTWKANVEVFCHYYHQDIPNTAGLPAEQHLWQRMWNEKKENAEDIPEKVSSTLKYVEPTLFPTIYTILQILATIPVASC